MPGARALLLRLQIVDGGEVVRFARLLVDAEGMRHVHGRIDPRIAIARDESPEHRCIDAGTQPEVVQVPGLLFQHLGCRVLDLSRIALDRVHDGSGEFKKPVNLWLPRTITSALPSPVVSPARFFLASSEA